MQDANDFVEKLEKILAYFQLSASAFADKIGVQRSSLSHLLSGRNKPGLEFAVKVAEAFPEVDLYWFLMDKGSFPKSNSSAPISSFEKNNLKPEEKNSNIEPKSNFVPSSNTENIDKIIVFYTNGTFTTHHPKK
ncbi:MAG: helix-turn-helix domain-containing protein [Flavobacterium sp.]|jgi:DNA-binding XRE family transcriptional regulator|uniref:helix-turn-helix domain-containing protein n=1 Tax=Flavobacterium sp. TaxID=239 RepID=UPI003BA70376